MKRLLIITILILSVFSLTNAQTKTISHINGTVIDKSTGKPIEYANIGIEGTYIGAASNMEGEFHFNIPPSQKGGSIYASAVGYKTVQLRISELPKTDIIIIEMHPQSYGIEEVGISAQSLVLYKIIREALDKININYINIPFSQQAYYKSQITINDTTKKVREATIEIYDATGYIRENKEQEYSNRKYRFLEVRENFNTISLSDGMHQMDELLKYDIVRSSGNVLDKDFLRFYDLSLEQITEYEGDSVWVINYSLENPDFSKTGDYYTTSYQGKLYINKSDYAVVKNETWVTASNYSHHGRSIAAVEGREWKPISIDYKFIVTYRKKNSIYNLAFIKSERKNRWESPDKKDKVISYENFLIPIETETVSPTRIKSREYLVNKPYNKEFWKTFNTMVD
jgi:hypothetical protein